MTTLQCVSFIAAVAHDAGETIQYQLDIGWRTKPGWFVLATKDHTVHLDLQRWVSKRMEATVTEGESSHVPMLSQPDIVIDVIRKAAAAVMEKKETLAYSS